MLRQLLDFNFLPVVLTRSLLLYFPHRSNFGHNGTIIKFQRDYFKEIMITEIKPGFSLVKSGLDLD